MAPVADLLNHCTGTCNAHLYYNDHALEVLSVVSFSLQHRMTGFLSALNCIISVCFCSLICKSIQI